MEAAKMSRVLIIFVLSLATLKVAHCDETEEDRHLCHQSVTVIYTEEVPKPLSEFGEFEKYFNKLGIPGGNKTVTKTRLEDELVCCPGYIKSDAGDCVWIQTTTETTTDITTDITTETTEEYYTSTELIGTTEMDQPARGSDFLSYILYLVLAIGVLIIFGATVYFFQKQKSKREHIKMEMEMENALINIT